MPVTLICLALGAALQLALLRRLAPSALVGDENEYALPADRLPLAAWVRVPLHRGLMQAAIRLWPSAPAVHGARLFVGVQALAALGLVTGYAEVRWGALPAALAGALLLLSLERAILALHLWPDTAIGLCWLAAALLVGRDDSAAALALAAVGGVALGLRIEGAALCAVAVAQPLAQGEPSDAALAAALCSGVAALYMAWNRHLSGRWQLDSTIGFNLRVARIDAATPTSPVAETMRRALAQTGAAPRSPARRHLTRLAARLRALLGPETFVTQALLQTGAARYGGGWRPDRPLVALALRHWFSLSMGLTLLLLPFAAPGRAALLGLAALVYALLVVRSRYRMALMPLMALICAEGLHAAQPDPQGWLAGLTGVLLLALVLWRAPRTDEIRQSA